MIINKENNFVSAIIYLHNNVDELKVFLPILIKTLETKFEKYEIICIDDVSHDESNEFIKNAVKDSSKIISIIHMGTYHGIEFSMNAGIDLSIGDFVFEFDYLDINYTEDLIMDVYYKSLQGYDVVSASPQKVSGLSSWLFYKVFNFNSIGENSLSQEIFRIVSRRAINRVNSINKNINYRKAAYHNCGLSISKIIFTNVSAEKRRYNKATKRVRENLAFESLVLYTNSIQKISIWISVLFLLFTISCGIYTWFAYFSAHRPVEGWTAMMLFLSMAFFGVFSILAIILNYMSIILNLIFKKQRYMIESVEKLTNN